MKTIRLMATATALLALTATASATGAQASSLATAPSLGTASYAVLAGTTVTNTGVTRVSGDLGVSPGTAVTGFLAGSGTVTGTIHAGDAAAAATHTDAAAAYANLVGQSCGTDLSAHPRGLSLFILGATDRNTDA